MLHRHCTVYSSDRFEVLQTLSFGRGFVLGVELFSLPDLPGEPLLACGGDDARINLFVRQEGKVGRHGHTCTHVS